MKSRPLDLLLGGSRGIEYAVDPGEIPPGEDLNVDSLCYSDSEINSLLNPDEILQGEDLEIHSLSYSDSEIASVFDPKKNRQGEGVEVDSLCYSDSEVDSEFDPDKVDSEETGRPSSPSTTTVEPVEIKSSIVDAIASVLKSHIFVYSSFTCNRRSHLLDYENLRRHSAIFLEKFH